MNNNTETMSFFNDAKEYMFYGKTLVNSLKYKLRDIATKIDMVPNEVLVHEPEPINIPIEPEPVIVSNKEIVSILVPKERKIVEETNNKPISTKKPSAIFFPKQKDALYWCFFIAKHGFAKYEYPNTTSFENEKTSKFECIYKLREKKDLLKAKKIKNIKEDVEDDLGSKDKISMKTFLALCIAENLNVLYIHKRKCFDVRSNETEPYHVIHCIDKPYIKYGYETNVDAVQVEKYRNEYFKWESYDKPLKAVSSYKVEELLDMCKQLMPDKTYEKKIGKKELYELLVMNL
jgi:hypothetical protein